MVQTNTSTTPQQHLSAGPESSTPAWQWRLHCLASSDPLWRGKIVPLGPGSHVLGRLPGAAAGALPIDDVLVSRAHLQVVVEPGGVALAVADLGSRNGSWCNGQPLSQTLAGHGAVLRLGTTVLVVEADSGQAMAFAEPNAEVPGRSERARQLREALHHAAHTHWPVLICGPTGTGKEHAATDIHQRSGRRGRLIRCNAAGIPPSLFEAEFFGNAAGAFTGAHGARAGLIAQAHQGTLVLDEIGELAMDLQPKLLRAFGEWIRPFGASGEVKVDVKFVASTNADLPTLVARGQFRADLLARLRHVTVQMPSLAQRRPDLLALADVVVPPGPLASGQRKTWAELLPVEAVEALALHPWPLNLRDLRLVLHAVSPYLADPARLYGRLRSELAQLAPPSAASKADTPPQLSPIVVGPAIAEPPAPPPKGPPRLRRRPASSELAQLLATANGNLREVARRLGCDPKQVYRWLKYDGVDVQQVRQATHTTSDPPTDCPEPVAHRGHR